MKNNNEISKILRLCKQKNINLKQVNPNYINSVLPHNSNHQGIALKASVIDSTTVEEVLNTSKESSTIILLDQVTDIHNVGSIIRSAVCFNVDAIILPYHNSPSENCGMSKTSSGAVDMIPIVYVINIVNTIKLLKKAGYWCYGFDAKEGEFLHKTKLDSKKLIIFGSEDKGMRKLTKENCDFLLKIAISKKIDSLNVSNAAAVALYSIFIQNYDQALQ
ncbi:RNA 2'-O ribose methyltransferase substrate binding family protein [Ehrlichia chaffeensis str. Heartland]|nr:RNA 2'-O ribose methyltransferase substrate binding family protein [Ehrlichia chaffeensis str. Heartland]AHX06763.1 RNA 2'-O ribose methyltransferase substrate binding family protein [Ehrlichia chaffeensis str. Liberty]AHX07613.1 RNA 2'-O ribose methyltransferase substrate binding family protein [Ehrlichia chaffeensis str. Osceola]AHX08949.1 RNA 2'-O ribose methyltransferase substrate binding family protein [Ehrlichia chaffeensis str. Saint Vincent]AHX09956.1 RNA 2'-O ribose methyltransferas